MKYPWYIAWCGDMDITGHRRPVSYYREIVFGLRTRPFIAVRYPDILDKHAKSGSWDFVDGICSWTWPGSEGQTVETEIYAPGDSVKLLLNGEVAGEAKLQDYKAVIPITYQPGELTAISYQDGKELGRFTCYTAGKDIHLHAVADRRVIQGNNQDLCYIDITLVDENGLVNTKADRNVTATVEGAGMLAGLGSANPKSEESFLTGSFHTYEGRLLAIVRPTGAGEIRLSLSAEDCEPVTVTIEAK
jgi:beta-galactosidase